MEIEKLLNGIRTNAQKQAILKKQAYANFTNVLRLWKKITSKSEIDFLVEFGECPTFVWDSWGGAAEISIEYIRRMELDIHGELQNVVVYSVGYNSDEEEISASEFFENSLNDLNFYSQMILEFLKL